MPAHTQSGDLGPAATSRISPPRWGVLMTVGVILLIGGVLALGVAVLTSLVSVVYLGVLLLAVGILEVISAVRVRYSELFALHFLAGILALLIGGFFLYQPLAGLGALTLLMAAYLFGSALFRGLTSVVDRYRGWGWDFAYGLVAAGLGVVVVTQWPISSSMWVVGTAVAAEIIARGATLVAAAWAIRDGEDHGMAA